MFPVRGVRSDVVFWLFRGSSASIAIGVERKGSYQRKSSEGCVVDGKGLDINRERGKEIFNYHHLVQSQVSSRHRGHRKGSQSCHSAWSPLLYKRCRLFISHLTVESVPYPGAC